jgi:hypothetical protein
VLELFKMATEWSLKVAALLTRRQKDQKAIKVAVHLLFFVYYMNEVVIRGGELLRYLQEIRESFAEREEISNVQLAVVRELVKRKGSASRLLSKRCG